MKNYISKKLSHSGYVMLRAAPEIGAGVGGVLGSIVPGISPDASPAINATYGAILGATAGDILRTYCFKPRKSDKVCNKTGNTFKK